ncbi:SDR family oxidoreductase [Altererythrobacter sp.]|uniref:SDR family oxidoreductase n=1 Tax=Altererythrobacter sp. TaxID=1872480 RepID=UPI003D05CD18
MSNNSIDPLRHLFGLEGKTAIVTGGSRGIGEMFARGYVEAGVRTYITSRKASDCEETARRLSEFGSCLALPYDLSTVEGIEALVSAFAEHESRLDILVNNAGATWGAPFDDYPESGWDKVVDLNLKSPFFLTQKLAPFLRQASGAEDPARIINIASINGITNPHADNFAYSASKAGVIQLTRHLAAALAAENINVNAIAPGLLMTKMMAHADETEIVKYIPRGRAGSADDAAGVAIFLASKASAWITGVTIPVDGGMVANA